MEPHINTHMRFGTYLQDKSYIGEKNIPNKRCKEKPNIYFMSTVLVRSTFPEINSTSYVCLICCMFNTQQWPLEEGDNYRKIGVFRTHTNIATYLTYSQIAYVR
jgi:hypothetical protein